MPQWQWSDALNKHWMYWSVSTSQHLMPKKGSYQTMICKLLRYESSLYIFAHIVFHIQDEVIVSDAERLHITQSNVKMVQLSPPTLPKVMLNWYQLASYCILMTSLFRVGTIQLNYLVFEFKFLHSCFVWCSLLTHCSISLYQFIGQISESSIDGILYFLFIASS